MVISSYLFLFLFARAIRARYYLYFVRAYFSPVRFPYSPILHP